MLDFCWRHKSKTKYINFKLVKMIMIMIVCSAGKLLVYRLFVEIQRKQKFIKKNQTKLLLPFLHKSNKFYFFTSFDLSESEKFNFIDEISITFSNCELSLSLVY